MDIRNSKCFLVLVSHAIEAEPFNVAQSNPELKSSKAKKHEKDGRDELGN